MSQFAKSVENTLMGIGRAFLRYPISIVAAFALAVVVSIQNENTQFFEEKFFQSLLLALTFGAALGMFLSAAIQKFALGIVGKIIMYLAGSGAAVAAFVALYFTSDAVLEEIIPRLVALSVLCVLGFLVIPSLKNSRYDFNDIIFMNLKAYFISGIYALVILLGLYAVAFAVQSLIYTEMSSTIYAHIGIFSLFLWYAFYLGHLPEFSEHEVDATIERAIRQPKFIEILNQYILIPLMAILSLVLAIWMVRILVFQAWPTFELVAAIFSFYSVLGILLYILVSSFELRISKLYRRIFPIVGLLFLAFEGAAIFNQVKVYGLSILHYFVILIWLGSVASLLFFLFIKVNRNRVVAYILAALTVVSVTPVIGYKDLPKTISNALGKNEVQNVKPAPKPVALNMNRVWLSLEKAPIDLKGYAYSLNVLSDFRDKKEYLISNNQESYSVKYIDSNGNSKIPRIQVERNNASIIDQDLSSYIRTLVEKYGTMRSMEKPKPLHVSEMSVLSEKAGIKLKIIFDFIRIEEYPSDSSQNYYGLGVSQILVGFA